MDKLFKYYRYLNESLLLNIKKKLKHALITKQMIIPSINIIF